MSDPDSRGIAGSPRVGAGSPDPGSNANPSDPFAPVGEVRLAVGRDWPIRRGHPWVYRGAIAGEGPSGTAPVAVRAADGTMLGIAMPGGSGGSLALRMLTRGDERWTLAGLHARLRDAAALRARLALDCDAFRLVHAEGDLLPGLVIDRYADWAVIEPFEPGWHPFVAAIADWLGGEGGARGMVLRRGGERGAGAVVLRGEAPAEPVVVREGSIRLPVDLLAGQKTGLFIDQRDNRRRVGELAREADVLNLFSYSCGFSIAALAGGARSAVNVDSSPATLALARAAYTLNHLTLADADFIAADAFQVVREMAGAGRGFDLVVVDPPAFVRRRAQLEAGLKGYKDINLQALRVLRPGGLLATFSCSALVEEAAFRDAVGAAAADLGVSLQILEVRGAGPDHPVLAACPEARHLKGLIAAVR